MYTEKPRTSAEIKADIAELKIAIALALDDDRADMESDLECLFEELDEAEAAESAKLRAKGRCPDRRPRPRHGRQGFRRHPEGMGRAMMHPKNHPPVFVPGEYVAELERLTKAALMDLAFSLVLERSPSKKPAEIMDRLRRHMAEIVTYRDQQL